MKKIITMFCCVAFGFIVSTTACNENQGFGKNKEGYHLSKTYCATCHAYPEPGLLNKKTWGLHVLPKMGGLMGFELFAGQYIQRGTTTNKLTVEEWNKMVSFYTETAPDKLMEKERPAINEGLVSFEVSDPGFSATKKPATTLLSIQEPERRIFCGDGAAQQLFVYSTANAQLDSVKVEEGISHARYKKEQLFVLSMGLLYPSDERRGKLVLYDSGFLKKQVLADSLQRPVAATYGDVNNDQREDIIICEFGDKTGALAWFENQGNDSYSKHVLRPLPGAIRTELHDFNKDGKPDIIALMAQGDEGVFVYLNQGNNKFTEQRLLQFPPSYGSNYFELADINNDGHIDMLITNGDNGDYPPVLKWYHGIRLYLNNGAGQFKEAVFLPVNGVGKAMARDFDRDGDLDIASIAYFPDYDKTPQESFVYWENTGNLSFKAHTIKEATAGRWITMDTGDADGDGDIDIVLGNADFPLGYIPEELRKKWGKYQPSMLILRNKLR